MGGAWKLWTRSVYGIRAMNAGISYTQRLFGGVAGVPMELRRTKRTINHEGMPVEKHILQLFPIGDPVVVARFLEDRSMRALVTEVMPGSNAAELTAAAELKGLPPPAADGPPAGFDNEPPADFDRETGECFRPPDSDAPVYETEARAAPDDTPPRPATCLDCNGKLAPKDYDDSQEVREALDIPESEGLCRKCRARRLVPAD